MLWLAIKTLFHERGRYIITLIGIIFSTVLTIVEIAIYMGMKGDVTSPKYVASIGGKKI